MKLEELSDKDYRYIIGLLVVAIIFLTVLFFGNRKDVVSYFSFAGTLVSIILSVLAIIYAFYQTASSTEQIHTLTKTAQQISGVTDEVTRASKSLNDVGETLRTTATGFELSQEKLADTVDQIVKRHVDNLRDIWLSESKTPQLHEPASAPGDPNSKVGLAPSGALIVLFMLAQQSRKPVAVRLDELIQRVNEHITEVRFRMPVDYAYGLLNGMRLTSLASYEYRPVFRVEFPIDFVEAVEGEFEKRIGGSVNNEEATILAGVREAILSQFER